MLRLGVLLLCVAALSPSAVDANLGGTAATTVPERSESSELLFKLAKQNSSYVVYPLDLLRLSTATKTRPKLMLNKIRPIGMILGEGRRRIWRRLTNTTNDGEISDEVRHSVDGGVLIGCLRSHAARQPSTPQLIVPGSSGLILGADLQALTGFLEAAHCKPSQSRVTLIEKDSSICVFRLWAVDSAKTLLVVTELEHSPIITHPTVTQYLIS